MFDVQKINNTNGLQTKRTFYGFETVTDCVASLCFNLAVGTVVYYRRNLLIVIDSTQKKSSFRNGIETCFRLDSHKGLIDEAIEDFISHPNEIIRPFTSVEGIIPV